MKTLSNGILELTISERGAEIQSLCKISNNREYIWNADPKYWNKHAPVLFPVIGRPINGGIVCNGQHFPIGKHGFASQLEFSCVEGDRILELTACDNEDTRKVFPYHFKLTVIYQLSRNKVIQKFIVQNTGDEEIMPFHIGGHPAFFLPDFKEEDAVHGYLSFDHVDEIQSNKIDAIGHFMDEILPFALDENGMLALQKDTFDCDTILETRGLISRTSLYDKERKPVLTVLANSKTIAYWSPSGQNAPFVCIEPWFGCCPKDTDTNVLAEQPMANRLNPGETFEAQLEIIIE